MPNMTLMFLSNSQYSLCSLIISSWIGIIQVFYLHSVQILVWCLTQSDSFYYRIWISSIAWSLFLSAVSSSSFVSMKRKIIIWQNGSLIEILFEVSLSSKIARQEFRFPMFPTASKRWLGVLISPTCFLLILRQNAIKKQRK